MVFKSSYAKKSTPRTPYMAKRTVSRKRNFSRGTRHRGLVGLIKRVALQNSEPKVASRLVSSLSTTDQDLKHNVTKYYMNFLETEQGITANPGTDEVENRIGNEIHAKGLKFRLQLTNAVTQSNVVYKIFIFKYNSDKKDTFGDTDFWCGPAGSGLDQNRMLDFVDTREVTVLKALTINTASRTANMNQHQSGVNNYLQDRMHSTYRDIWIPLNQKIIYDANNSTVPKFKDIGMAILAYDVNNTAETQTLGYIDFCSRLYFKDP